MSEEKPSAVEAQLERRVRPRSLAVGQLWSAKFIDSDGSVTKGCYTFKIVHEERHYFSSSHTFRNVYLGVKMYVDRDPANNGQVHAQCWWFDERGSAHDSDGDFVFLLTRKKRPNVGGNRP